MKQTNFRTPRWLSRPFLTLGLVKALAMITAPHIALMQTRSAPQKNPDFRIPQQDYRPLIALGLLLATMMVLMPHAALAQAVDLSPIQNFVDSIVKPLTGSLGMSLATIALIGTAMGVYWGRLDLGQAFWIIIAIVVIGSAALIVQSLWGTTVKK